jgi:hypothetical protein
MTGGQGIVIDGSVTGRPRDARLLAWGVAGVIAQAAFMAGWVIAEAWQGPDIVWLRGDRIGGELHGRVTSEVTPGPRRCVPVRQWH